MGNYAYHEAASRGNCGLFNILILPTDLVMVGLADLHF
jgi:hypothetical protein